MILTRMHSRRMRTVRCSDRLDGGCLPGGCLPGGCLPGGCLPRGVSVQGGLPRRVCPGGLSQHALRQTTPLDRMTDRCKTLPCRNFVADGNKVMKIVPLPSECEGAFKQLFIKLDDFDSMNAGKSSQLGKHGFGSLDNFNWLCYYYNIIENIEM